MGLDLGSEPGAEEFHKWFGDDSQGDHDRDEDGEGDPKDGTGDGTEISGLDVFRPVFRTCVAPGRDGLGPVRCPVARTHFSWGGNAGGRAGFLVAGGHLSEDGHECRRQCAADQQVEDHRRDATGRTEDRGCDGGAEEGGNDLFPDETEDAAADIAKGQADCIRDDAPGRRLYGGCGGGGHPPTPRPPGDGSGADMAIRRASAVVERPATVGTSRTDPPPSRTTDASGRRADATSRSDADASTA